MSTVTTTRRPFPANEDTEDPTCPDCDGTRLVHAETLPVTRRLSCVVGGTLIISMDESVWWECGTDEHIECVECRAEFELPEDVDYA